ncbi:MAG: TIGR02452 family protein [Eubacterium sp.]|nr:TIGR02452 family protein [Eubacterium sp.]
MNNISIANETINITKEGSYLYNGEKVDLPDIDLEEVIVISPEDGQALLDADLSDKKQDKLCNISVINADSFQAGRKYENALVMNFANAHSPGGGFRLGANAQEEALCSCSTLYASITSKEASKMYLYNNTHPSRVESDYMLISPNVAVFRDEACNLLEKPEVMGVVTVPAPNRYGAALLAGNDLIRETFVRRIRIMLAAAAKYGYKNLVLGAWGCGAFGNDPEDVANYFKQVIIDEQYGFFFDEICFAIYGRPDGNNITTFKSVF